MSDVPPAVAGVVGDWQAGGRPGQQGIRWPRERWLAAFPETADALQVLPVRLDRGAVGAACAGAAASSAAAWQAFVVVMAWGYGTVGYGAWRTARILQGDSHAPDRLASVAQRLVERGALDAYGLLGGACRLQGLGPAFGTKYLYFCPQSAAGPRALILDRLVARWLARNAHVSLNPGFWSSNTYGRYLELLGSWAEALGTAADEVEMCIFQAEADTRGNQWATAPWPD